MPSFELQSCVGYYQTIINTNVVANSQQCAKIKAATIFYSNNKHTLWGQRNKDV